MTIFSKEAIEEATAIRRQLHSFPELKFEEFATSDLVAETLQRYGYELRRNVAGTGIVATLDTGRAGATIGLRADMDALPIQEETGLAYASTIAGKMHACGHDGHTATLLLAAGQFAQDHAKLNGKIKLLFQPAEEVGKGAAQMIADGALEGVEQVFGFHNRPGYALGHIITKAGPAMGGNTLYEVKISGKGGHASRPDLAIDPIFVGSAIVQSLQSVISRRLSPLDAGVVTVTQFNGGSAGNIIPGDASMVINTRDGSPEAAAIIDAELRKVIANVCEAHGAQCEVNMTLRIPSLVNSVAETELVVETAHELFSKNNTSQMSQMPTMGAEDFAFYLEQRPGSFFFVGNGEDSAYLHHPLYNFRDEVLPVAAGMFVGIAHKILAK